MLLLLFLAVGVTGFLKGDTDLEARDPINRVLWEFGLADFGRQAYAEAVETLFRAFEEERGYGLRPGEHGRVGLKVYTQSGPGISTPVHLVRAVVRSLLDRGFRRDQLFLIDLDENRLRDAGFLPSRVEPARTFDGIPVYALHSGQFYHEAWYYDNPLPAERRQAQRTDRLFEYDEAEGLLRRYEASDRKSFLAVPLLLEVDFWINLPMAMDHPAIGVSGALANPTLWNVSNNRRFLINPATAPAAAAEIAAIPELRDGWVFTLLTLERYQYIGGPRFNSLYTRSEPRLLLSTNPVAMDFEMLDRINRARRENGFGMILQEQPLFYYAETLGLGAFDRDQLDWRVLGQVYDESVYTDADELEDRLPGEG